MMEMLWLKSMTMRSEQVTEVGWSKILAGEEYKKLKQGCWMDREK